MEIRSCTGEFPYARENRKVTRGRVRTPRETSVTSAVSEDAYRKTVGTKIQEEKKGKGYSQIVARIGSSQ